MEVAVSLCCLLGMGYGVYRGLRWMMAAGNVHTRKSSQLTPADLKVLEESAERLMADIRATTDECVARIEQACAHAQKQVTSLERSSSTNELQPTNVSLPTNVSTATCAPTSSGGLYQRIDANESPALIARESGMTTGEVELMRALQAMEAHK